MVSSKRSEDRIVKTPGVCGGDAHIKGTRVTVWGLEEWRRLGWSNSRILDAYPRLKPDDLDAAWGLCGATPRQDRD
jgi:uncharacterized protein (DUF433 family)